MNITVPLKRACLALLIIFFIGFSLSSGIAQQVAYKFTQKMQSFFDYHMLSLQREASHYFLFSEGGYRQELYENPLSYSAIFDMLWNALLNGLFQPVFLCVFTPQAVFNCILFPFFLCGIVVHFKKVSIMAAIFFSILLYVSLYGSVVEALIRHRMACELIYLLIGIAGFTSLITEKSY